MKKMLILVAIAALCSCGGTKNEAVVVTKKVVCGDSVEQAMYDETGKEYVVRVPGKCDTIIEKAAE